MLGPKQEGSGQKFLYLCLSYFMFYVVSGVAVKYFVGPTGKGFPGLNEIQYLVYNTLGAQFICLGISFWKGWLKIKTSTQMLKIGKFALPIEVPYISLSGFLKAITVPTTTLMYLLPISVMVAMIIMRGTIIVASRLVDEIQLRQGITTRKVTMEENLAVVLALLAALVDLFLEPKDAASGDFNFIHSPAALIILGTYVSSYSVRLYIMNYFKNTAGKGVERDNCSFFGIEQTSTFVTLLIIAVLVFFAPQLFNISLSNKPLLDFRNAVMLPHSAWFFATMAGLATGMASLYSVFIFMFKGRSATFSGAANRMSSLIAGTVATLISYFFFGTKFPSNADWASLGLIILAVALITHSEMKRQKSNKHTEEATDETRNEKLVLQTN